MNKNNKALSKVFLVKALAILTDCDTTPIPMEDEALPARFKTIEPYP